MDQSIWPLVEEANRQEPLSERDLLLQQILKGQAPQQQPVPDELSLTPKTGLVKPGNAGTVTPAAQAKVQGASVSSGSRGAGIVSGSDWQTLLSRERPDSLKQQEAAIKDQEQLIKKMTPYEHKIDFSPLMALSDSWGGTNLAKNYQRPETEEEHQAKLADLNNKLLAQKNALSGNDNDLIKLSVIKQANDAASKNARFDENMQFKKETQLQQDLDKDLFDPINKRSAEFGQIDAALAKGDWATIGATMSQFSRGIAGEKGVLTDKDVERVMPKSFQGDLAKLKSYFANTPTEQMDPAYVKGLQELSILARKNAADVYGRMVSDKRRLYGSRATFSGMMSPGSSGDMMLKTAENRITDFGKSATGAPPTDPARARLEELRRKAAQQ